MPRTLRSALFLVTVLASATSLLPQADCNAGWSDYWNGWKVDYHRNHCWPEPFMYPDRQATRAPWEIMKNNGWRLNNTLHDPLFNERNELTRAGKLKVQWIATQAVPPRRVIFVLAGSDQEVTQQRLFHVQQMVANLAIDGQSAQVFLTTKQPRGGSGDYFDRVGRMARESIPAPVLPPNTNTSGGGGGGGGSSN